MRLHKTCQGFALFIAWFNGICATVCGLWMALSAVAELPLSWNILMPVSILNPLPIPTFMKEGFLWAGVALVIVNGVPNICAVVERLRKKEKSFCFWGLVAGCALVLWTTFELAFIPNVISVAYLVLGIAQLYSNLLLRRDAASVVD